ncbi:hypothetical protein ACLB2K_020316 [Fragaria x ananassa]
MDPDYLGASTAVEMTGLIFLNGLNELTFLNDLKNDLNYGKMKNDCRRIAHLLNWTGLLIGLYQQLGPLADGPFGKLLLMITSWALMTLMKALMTLMKTLLWLFP